MPKVSVVIPVYGVEKYIERCARSLFGQTLASMEYVFIDDCSPDNSIAIMQKVLEEYPQRKDQVKVIRHEVNQGVGAARNHGVAACTGDYVIHCDPDDWVDPQLYETAWNKAMITDADVVTLPLIIEYNNNLPAVFVIPQETSDIEGYIKKNTGCHLNSLSTKLYRRNIVFDKTLKVPDYIFLGEDLLRNIQMLNLCRSITFITDCFYHYRQHSTSITHSFTDKHFLSLKGVYDIIQQLYSSQYYTILRKINQTMLIASLRNLNKNSGLIPLFHEVWTSTPFKEKLRIVFATKNSIKCRLAVAAMCISKPLTIFFLRHIP